MDLKRGWMVWAGLFVVGCLSGCGVSPIRSADEEDGRTAEGIALGEPVGTSVLLPGEFRKWQVISLPGKRYAPFRPVEHEAVQGVEVNAVSSLSLLRWSLGAGLSPKRQLGFSWWVDGLVPGADLSDVESSDSPVRLVLAFDGDRARFSARNAMLSELSRALTGEEMPYATLMYVWSNDLPVGQVLHSPRTDRVRYLVVERGAPNVRRWVHHQRDVHADYVRAFGEQPGSLLAIALMTDTDNTRSKVRAVYGPVTLDAAH